MNLVKLCLDFRGVLQLGLEVLPDLAELVVNDSEDFSTLNLRSRRSCRSRSSSRTSRPASSHSSCLFRRHRVPCSAAYCASDQRDFADFLVPEERSPTSADDGALSLGIRMPASPGGIGVMVSVRVAESATSSR
jgi:hypothetical protein